MIVVFPDHTHYLWLVHIKREVMSNCQSIFAFRRFFLTFENYKIFLAIWKIYIDLNLTSKKEK